MTLLLFRCLASSYPVVVGDVSPLQTLFGIVRRPLHCVLDAEVEPNTFVFGQTMAAR